MSIKTHGKKTIDLDDTVLDFVDSTLDDGTALDIGETVLLGGSFGGSIKIKSLQRPHDNLSNMQTYNLVGGNGTCVSDMFNGLAIPSVLLHIPKFYGGDPDIESEEEDNEKHTESYYGGKKQLMHNNPTAGVISEDLYDKFLKMAQDLDMYKSNRKTKKHPLLKSSKKMKKTRRNK
jgi:hypothetical protein